MTEHKIDLTAIVRSFHGAAHSIFAPSSSAMWLHCSGSLIANLLAPDDAGEDAAYGTVGHAVGEQWLKTGVKPIDRISEVVAIVEGKETFNIVIDRKMIDYVEQYVMWCAPLPGDHYVERKVYFSKLTPLEMQGGTADHAALSYRKMVVTDLKMGMGHQVYAYKNSQGLLYALGTFYEWDWLYDFQEITIRICQPRLGHFDTWTLTRAELLAFAEFVSHRSALAWQPNAPRSPSPHACKWCRVKPQCGAHAKQLLDLAAGDLTAIDRETVPADLDQLRAKIAAGEFKLALSKVEDLSTDELSALYPFVAPAKAWWEALSAELYRRAMAGQNLTTAKLIKGRGGIRKWKDAKIANRVLLRYGLKQDQVELKTMKSPTQVEEALRDIDYTRGSLKGLLDPITVKAPAGLILASIQDKRAAVKPETQYDAAFDDLILAAPDPDL